ncbi:MAG: glycosyltransferase family 4 protein [Bacillota bacterium]|jgi:glycosyltransferase involved in cell wall biosynthesis
MMIGIDARGAIWYRGTGIGTYTFQLINHLKRRTEADQYRLFWPGEEYVGLDIYDEEKLRQIESGSNYWEEYYLPGQLEKEKIDIYHVPQNGIGLPGVKKCKEVVTIHDLIPYIYPETVGKGYLKTFLSEMPKIIDRADRVITVSHCSKKDIEYIFKYPGDRIDVIYEAPEPIYQPRDEKACRQFLADQYGISQDFILYVGGFSPRKNVKALLTAYAYIQDDLRKPCLLVLPGRRQKEFDQIDIMINALDLKRKVVFPGFVPVRHLPYFYQCAQLFVYPSFYEGFGLPPLEAMACGTPTLAADTSSIPEVVGQSAILFNPFNALDLAEKILYVLSHWEVRDELRKKGLNQARKFSWSQNAAETVKVYQKIFYSDNE